MESELKKKAFLVFVTEPSGLPIIGGDHPIDPRYTLRPKKVLVLPVAEIKKWLEENGKWETGQEAKIVLNNLMFELCLLEKEGEK